MGWKFWKQCISLKHDHTQKFECQLWAVRCFWLIGEYSCNCSCVLFVCQISSLNHGYKNHVTLKSWSRNSCMDACMQLDSSAKHLFLAVMFWHLGIASLCWTIKRQGALFVVKYFNINVFILRKQATNLPPAPTKKRAVPLVLFM